MNLCEMIFNPCEMSSCEMSSCKMRFNPFEMSLHKMRFNPGKMSLRKMRYNWYKISLRIISLHELRYNPCKIHISHNSYHMAMISFPSFWHSSRPCIGQISSCIKLSFASSHNRNCPKFCSSESPITQNKCEVTIVLKNSNYADLQANRVKEIIIVMRNLYKSNLQVCKLYSPFDVFYDKSKYQATSLAYFVLAPVKLVCLVPIIRLHGASDIPL